MDVLALARIRREDLRADLEELERFVRTAEWLLGTCLRDAARTAAPRRASGRKPPAWADLVRRRTVIEHPVAAVVRPSPVAVRQDRVRTAPAPQKDAGSVTPSTAGVLDWSEEDTFQFDDVSAKVP